MASVGAPRVADGAADFARDERRARAFLQSPVGQHGERVDAAVGLEPGGHRQHGATRAELDLRGTLTGGKLDRRARNGREPSLGAHAEAGDVGLAIGVDERDRLVRHVHEIAVRGHAERRHAARGERRAGDGTEAAAVDGEHGDAVAAWIDSQHVPAVNAHGSLGVEITTRRDHETAATRGERRASHLGERAVVVPGQDDHAVALAVVVERVRVAVAGRAGQPGLDELSDGKRGRDEEEDCFHDGLPFLVDGG